MSILPKPEKGKQHLDDAESIDVEIYTLKELCDMIYAGKSRIPKQSVQFLLIVI